MARKKKNSIFEQQATEPSNVPCAEAEKSMAECVPDSPEQLDRLESELARMSQLQAELHAAKQRIEELEAEAKRLQSDNDMLVMKLAESSACSIQQAQCGIQHEAAPAKQQEQVAKAVRKPVSKKVQYKHPEYRNNGYGTWH